IRLVVGSFGDIGVNRAGVVAARVWVILEIDGRSSMNRFAWYLRSGVLRFYGLSRPAGGGTQRTGIAQAKRESSAGRRVEGGEGTSEAAGEELCIHC
ncbi:hypothetical protein LTR28_005298, partial [Elasticomyces elasticus]